MNKYLITFFLLVFHNPSFAKDVSNEITGTKASLVLSCIIRLEIYAENTLNMFEMPDPNYQKSLTKTALMISMPYKENIINAAWTELKTLYLNDWDAFYSQQIDSVSLNFETNNVFFDTFTCVRELVQAGVIYPLQENPSKMPPEQRQILMDLFNQR